MNNKRAAIIYGAILLVMIIFCGISQYQLSELKAEIEEQSQQNEALKQDNEKLEKLIHDLKREVIEQDEKIFAYQNRFGTLP